MLKVSVCQTHAVWNDTARNLNRIEPLVAEAPGDVVLLPEMFATGFRTDPAAIAEPDGGPVSEAMRRWAARYRKAIAGSVAVSDRGTFRNRMFFVKPSGETLRYDKHHLFRPGGEAQAYEPGRERVVAEYGGVRFLLLVCYDLRFPVWIRNRGDYDALLCCAAWPAQRRSAWQTLLRARAIENQCYAAGANRSGTDPGLTYAGDSALVGFRGETLADAGAAEGIRTAEFDTETLAAFRERFPAWADADGFVLDAPSGS